jgi:PKD repeat protein
MQGKGAPLGREPQACGGRAAPTATIALALLACLLAVALAPSAVSAAPAAALPDLTVMGLYNVSTPIVGLAAYFNVTILNAGPEAYLQRTNGTLDVYAYRDGETQVASVVTVYEDIYPGENTTVDVMVTYATLGRHSLRIVLDEMGRVAELNDTNNGAEIEFDVVQAPVNRAPHADGGNDRTGYVGRPMLFSAEWSSDPDGTALTFAWDFGDSAHGAGEWTNHTYGAIGDYRAQLRVSDGWFEDTDNFTVHVVVPPVNHPPKAVIDAAAMTVEAGFGLQLDGRGSTDQDASDVLIFSWDLDASDGVDDWIRGALITATWGEAGSYTVTLSVSDGQAASTAQVIIVVTVPPPPNKSPTANAGPDTTAVASEQFRLQGSGSDPDGQVLVYEWDVNGDGVYETYSETDGELVWTFEDEGMHTLRLRVTDARGASSSDAALVNVLSDGGGGGEDGRNDRMVMAVVAIAATALVVAVVVLALGLRRGRGDWPRSKP